MTIWILIWFCSDFCPFYWKNICLLSFHRLKYTLWLLGLSNVQIIQWNANDWHFWNRMITLIQLRAWIDSPNCKNDPFTADINLYSLINFRVYLSSFIFKWGGVWLWWTKLDKKFTKIYRLYHATETVLAEIFYSAGTTKERRSQMLFSEFHDTCLRLYEQLMVYLKHVFQRESRYGKTVG